MSRGEHDRRVRDLCKAARVPRVVPHSLRGLNATLRKTGGATDDTITRALGHVSSLTRCVGTRELIFEFPSLLGR